MYETDKKSPRKISVDSSIPLRKKSTVLFVGSNGAITENLARAVEWDMPDVAVEQADSLRAALEPLERPAALILVSTRLVPELEHLAGELAAVHPAAAIGLLHDGARPLLLRPDDIAAFGVESGVLAMDVKLDVWLAVIRLMLHGGAYYPPAMFRNLAAAEPAHRGASLREADDMASFGHRPPGAAELTSRETQVLEMVSRGLQNKNIAAFLKLSEHTVKIHLHNIMTKLGVHNRTEAASLYRGGRDMPPPAAPAPTPPEPRPLQ